MRTSIRLIWPSRWWTDSLRSEGADAIIRGVSAAGTLSGGAGKSTFSRRLGGLLGLRVIHLDALFWGAGWREPDRDEWESTVRRISAGESWVMDGNYGGTMDLRLSAADAVMFLDLPRRLYMRRVIYRRFRYARRSRPDMAPGCPERIDLQFLKYLWRYPRDRCPGILQKLRSLPQERTAVVLRSPAEVGAFLEDLSRSL